MLVLLPMSLREKMTRMEQQEKFHRPLPLLKVAVEGGIAIATEGDHHLEGKGVVLDLALHHAHAPDLEIEVTIAAIVETNEVEEIAVEIEHRGKETRKWMKKGTRRFKRGLMLQRRRKDERMIPSPSPSGMMMIRYVDLPDSSSL